MPFYLVTQFGKSNVLNAVEVLCGQLPEGKQRTRLEGIAYWARMPAASLIDALHYFEWEETIERH